MLTVMVQGLGIWPRWPQLRLESGDLARHGRGARRHNDRCFRMTLDNGGGNTVLVVCAVAGEQGHGSRHWLPSVNL